MFIDIVRVHLTIKPHWEYVDMCTGVQLGFKRVLLWVPCGRLNVIDTNALSPRALDSLREILAKVID